ncbi:histidine utilization repressor [Geopsychrobacter electrodiphilus]|uniref:histidine utilization repressor n=1 Tax=Geopsychrobacter electrodiphilus TaxID=225196 RepID=UPI00035D5B28
MQLAKASQPRYQAIKEFICRQIRDGAYPPGAQVPTEQQLTRLFEVSRMTVNRALRELESEGMLLRRQGVGTFVSEIQAESPLLEIRNIADEVRARHHVYSNLLHRLEEVTADQEIAGRLGLQIGTKVFHSLLVHLENGVPLQLEDRYVNAQIVPDYLNQDFSGTTPGQYLSGAFPLSELEHIVEAILPDERMQKLLGMGKNEPCLLVKRRTWSNERLVSCAHLIHPGSRYRLSSRTRTSGTI